jgi:DNA-binding MarR family transcriptional regulator
MDDKEFLENDPDPATALNDLSARGTGCSHEALKRFRQIFKAVQQHSQRVEQRCGLTSAQLWAVSELARCPGQRVSDVASAMSIHPSTASNLLDKLEKRGIVRKERQSDDQRVVRLSLTDCGQQILANAPQPAEGILQSALFALPDPVLRSLLDTLDLLVSKMQIDVEWAGLEPLGSNALPSITEGSGHS